MPFDLCPPLTSGSPAELCHLCVGDEILSVGGQKVAHMSYTQWKSSMADALAKGNLLMDIRRHGHAGEARRVCVCALHKDSQETNRSLKHSYAMNVSGLLSGVSHL